MLYLQRSLFQYFRFYQLSGFFFAFLLASLTAASVWAGGGPENVFLVVNPQSADSMTIANDYLRLRQIPAGNIFYLPWDPKKEEVDVDAFRNTILKPILEAIRNRRLTAQIDYVIYSSDFPWQVTLHGDVAKFKDKPFPGAGIPKTDLKEAGEEKVAPKGVPSACTPVGSINGMTYLSSFVMQNTPAYFDLQSNHYLRVPIEAQKDKPTLGFRSVWQFGPQGELVEKEGASYLLSTMLGVTAGRGNTVAEILKYLERSAKADGNYQQGTIYFMKNSDIRSTVRDKMFPETVKELKKTGVDARIVDGTVPINRRDVQGVCMGTSDFDWKSSGSSILPGAICEHFTSYGGMMMKNGQQTPLTEFLRYGAAGASGTVTEPYAILQKFPLPLMQLHYARGCTLAEAFYQSVFGPYQLLIVGDPLCRPWANIPKVEISGIKNGDIVKGELTITPTATLPKGGSIERFELFVNGSRAAQCKSGETLKLDTTLLPDGFQELRIVAVENSLIQSQGRAIYNVNTNNYGRKIEVFADPHDVLKSGDKLKLNVKSPGSVGVCIMQNSRIVGRIAGEEGAVEIAADELGSGKVKLQAIGLGKGGPKSHVLAVPMEVDVDLKKG
jgi:hypothetical protein